jgi:hypothetical protein
LGYTKKEALEITDRRIGITWDKVRNHEITPNLGNGKDHIYKIIAHKGKHSKGRGPVLKYAIQEYLQH